MSTFAPFSRSGLSLSLSGVITVLFMLLATCSGAVVTENFDTFSDLAYDNLSDYGEWVSTNARVDNTKQRGVTGNCVVFDDDAGAWLVYEGADGAGKDGGVGTISFWYRHWDGTAAAVAFQTQYSQGGGSWINVGGVVNVTSTNYAQFTVDANVSGDDIQVRVLSSSFAERLCLDDFSIGDFVGGPVDDPNLVVASALDFGQIEPGTSATQGLALANTGASNTLHLTTLTPFSGDTNRFSIGVLPPTILPGGTGNVTIIYTPGSVTDATHSAVYRLITDDPTTPTQTLTFAGRTAAASLTISNIQYSTTNASPLNGTRVYIHGIASYADTNGYGLADPAGGRWSGVFVTDPFHRPNTGDHVYLEGLVFESRNMTVLTNVALYSVEGTGNAVPVTTIHGNDVTNEAYEGVLVGITNVAIKNVNFGNGKTFWQAGDTSANFFVSTRCPYRFIWNTNLVLTAIRGLVFQSLSTNSISPRFDDDFIGRPVLEYALRGLVMTPNGPRTNWYVHVWDDDIVSVTSSAPGGVTVVDTGGIIFPGMIDAHNHPAYNSFPTLMFNNFPYGHRDEWGEFDAEYDDWKIKRTALRSHAAVNDANKDTITKYGECLEMMAGCVAIQGQSNNDPEHSHPDVILYNIEQFPSRIFSDIFPWTSTAAERSNLLSKISGGSINASMIHLCEGPDATSLAQFATWRNWGMLNETVAIIHGTPLGPSQFAEMAAVGAKIVWAPMSNMKLYGATVNVKAAKDAGVVIGLSPDWTPSGCFNLLEELGYAWHLNQTVYSNAFSAKEMCDMVSINNAKCAGLDDRYGRVAAGYNAGLMVIEGNPAEPYLSLIYARPGNVLLTIIDGTPRYGEPSLMSALSITGENVNVKGRAKVFNIAFQHPFLDYSTNTFANIQSNLQTGHATLTPINELDRDELQFLDLALLEKDDDDVLPFRADNPISAGPGGGTYDVGTNLSLAFRYQDFWDNNTFLTNLVHTINIVPVQYSNLVLQTIATNLPNDPSHQTVNFTVAFKDMHTNYQFCFVTRDAQGNQRTTQVSSVTFKLATHTGGDSDRDGIPNEWESAYFGTFTGALASSYSDSDALNNLEEYIADTNPTNPASFFPPVTTTTSAVPGTLTLVIEPTSPARVYEIRWTANLSVIPQVWQLYGSGKTGTGASVTFPVTNDILQRIYRSSVRLP